MIFAYSSLSRSVNKCHRHYPKKNKVEMFMPAGLPSFLNSINNEELHK
jgi:hypothetical protein